MGSFLSWLLWGFSVWRLQFNSKPGALIQRQVTARETVVGEMAMEQAFLWILLFLHANHHSTTAPYSSVTTLWDEL
jgi:hypothetical protein